MSYLRYFCLFMQSGAQHLLCCVCFVCLRIVYPLLMLTRKLLNKRFLLVKLKSSLRTFYGRHHDLVDRYRISVSQMTADMFHFFNQINTTSVPSGAGTAHSSGARDFTPAFSGVRVTRFAVLCVCCLSFFFWPLCCLYFFDIQIFITPFVSSNSFYHFLWIVHF